MTRKHTKESLTALFGKHDRNGNGVLEMNELPGMLRSLMGATTLTPAAVDTLRRALDANDDGLVSPNEYGARLVNMFARMDTNGNGILEGDELPRRMKKGGHQKGHMKTPGADS